MLKKDHTRNRRKSVGIGLGYEAPSDWYFQTLRGQRGSTSGCHEDLFFFPFEEEKPWKTIKPHNKSPTTSTNKCTNAPRSLII